MEAPESPYLIWWMLIDSPKKTKRQFPYNREVYRLSVLLASDIVKNICEGNMTKEWTPEFIQAQKLVICDIMNLTRMTLKETEEYLKDFCMNWTLDVVPVFPDQNPEEVSADENLIAAELFEHLVAFAVEDFVKEFK